MSILNKRIESPSDFVSYAGALQAKECFREPLGWGIFRQEFSQLDNGKVLTGTYPVLNWTGKNLGSFSLYADAAGLFDEGNAALWQQPELVLPVTPDMVGTLMRGFEPYLDEAKGRSHQNVQVAKHLANQYHDLVRYQLVIIFDDVPPTTLATAYMKLMALSKCYVKPLELNVQGIFGLLPNVAWQADYAIDLDWLRDKEVEDKMNGNFIAPDYVDKFPRYLMQVIPEDSVRILATDTVRFGAHLAPGTTVMPGASYINFNSGTLSAAMVEGRISSSATVGEGTDVGGGASILGVLSGGNKTPISIGKNCLLGANSVTGIPLGDGCIVDAGVAILAGTMVYLYEADRLALVEVNPGFAFNAADSLYKASKLAGLHGLHFRLDSTTGQMIVKRSTKTVELNAALHA